MHRKRLGGILVAAAALIAVAAVFVMLPPARAFGVRTIAAAYLFTHGFRLERADIELNHGIFAVRDLDIREADSSPFLSAKAFQVRYGQPGRAYGISEVVLDQPRLVVRRESDGSFNINRLLGKSKTGGGPLPQLRLSAHLRNGTLNVINTYAPSGGGHVFAVRNLDATAAVDVGAISRFALRGVLDAGGARRPFAASGYENDVARVAQASLHTTRANIAAPFNVVVSAPTFVLASGRADANLRAYALDWNPSAGPAWHFEGNISIVDAALRVFPLAVPVHLGSTDLSLADGLLTIAPTQGDVGGIPLETRGTVEIFPDTRLGLQLKVAGDLSQARSLLAVSAAQPLKGTVQIAARIEGTPASPHVAFSVSCPKGLRYAALPVKYVGMRGYFADQHLTLLGAQASYESATFYGDGDIDVSKSPTAQVVILASAPANRVPVLGNIDDSGTVRARVSVEGPLNALSGSGFAQLQGTTRVRAAFAADPQRFTFGPVLAQSPNGGSLFAQGSVDRDPAQTLNADLVANNFRVRFSSKPILLPGIPAQPIVPPAIGGTLEGAAQAIGPLKGPAVAVRLQDSGASVAGMSLGTVSADATGVGGRYELRRLAATGRMAHFVASGELVAAGPSTKGSRWIAAARVRDAGIIGVPLRSADVFAGEDRGQYRIYAATARLGKGQLGALGRLPAAKAPGTLLAYVRQLDLSALGPIHMPVSAGMVTGSASLKGTLTQPRANFAAALAGGALNGVPVSGDVQAAYDKGVLRTNDSRIALGGNMVDLRGSVRGIALNANASPAASASMDFDAAVTGANLAELAQLASFSGLPINGELSAQLHINGSPTDPLVSGTVTSLAGSYHGVGYQGLAADISASRRGVTITRGQAQIESSDVSFAGALAPGAVRMSVASPRVDLADFDDYFNGKDVLDGVGPLNVAIASGGGGVAVNGFARLAGVRLMETPVGDVTTTFATANRRISADVSARGPFGAFALAGSTAFGPSNGMVPDFRRAAYDLRGSAKNVDLGLVAAYANLPLKVAGTLGADFNARGTLPNLRGRGTFATSGARIGRNRKNMVPVQRFAGTLSTTGRLVTLERLDAVVPGLAVSARGSFDRAGRIVAAAVFNARDLSQIAKIAGAPNVLTGSAIGTLEAQGPMLAPVGRATLRSTGLAVRGVQIANARADASYSSNRVTIDDATLALAAGGTIGADGSFPLRLMPLGIGPRNAPVALSLTARGVNLAALNPFFQNAANVAGNFEFHATARGTVAKPRFTGAASMRNGQIVAKLERTPLRNVSADATFANDRIALSDLHATAGAGSLDARATARVDAASSSGMLQNAVAELNLHRAQFDVPNYAKGTADGSIRFTANGLDPVVSGDVTFSDTNIPFASILALAAGGSDNLIAQEPSPQIPGVPSPKPGHTIVYGGSVYGDKPGVLTWHPPRRVTKRSPPPPLSPLNLQLTVAAANNVRISGLVDVTAKGQLGVEGSASKPILKGAFQAVRGHVGVFGATFRLLRGAAIFRPQNGLLPVIDAKAYADFPQASITADVAGRVDKLNTDLSSDPEMTRQEILATLLSIGKINEALAGGGGNQLDVGRAAQTLVDSAVSNILAGGVSSALQQVLPFEDVNLAFNAQGQPTIELRKQFGPSVYSIYRTTMAGTPQASYGVAYYAHHRLDIEVFQTQPLGTGLQGVSPLPVTSIQVTFTFTHH